MKNREINHLLWQLQYESNQDKGYKDSLNFKDILTAQIFIESDILHGTIFTDPKIIQKAFNKDTNFLLVPSINKKVQLPEEFMPNFVSAPMDELSLKDALNSEYIDLIKKHERDFAFTIIHFVPLEFANDDKDNDWIKKVGDIQIKKKLDTWLKNKNQIYLKNVLTTYLQNQLEQNNITNNWHTPLFLVSNIDFNDFNNIKVVDKIFVYIALIDSENKKLQWIKVSKDFFVKKQKYQFNPAEAINVLNFDLDPLKNARNIKLENDSFLILRNEKIQENNDFEMIKFYKNKIDFGDFKSLSLQDKLIDINDKRIEKDILELHNTIYKWYEEIKNLKK